MRLYVALVKTLPTLLLAALSGVLYFVGFIGFDQWYLEWIALVPLLVVLDGIQTVAAGALRGLNDTRMPLLFATISYWLVGYTCAALFGFHTSLGASGVWVGLSCGTAVYATLLVSRFHLLSRRRLPEPPHAS